MDWLLYVLLGAFVVILLGICWGKIYRRRMAKKDAQGDAHILHEIEKFKQRIKKE